MDGKEIIHYSIPNIDAAGGPLLGEGSSILSPKLRVRGEELLVSRLNPRKGRVLITTHHDEMAVCSGEFVMMKSRGADLRFAFYAYSSEYARQSLDSQVRSTTRSHQRVPRKAITTLPIPIPDLRTQQAIVAFLDRETGRIDELVDKKKRFIELLEEKRAALVHGASELVGTQHLRIGVVAELVRRPIAREDDEVYTPVGLYNRGRGIFHKEPTLGADLGDSHFFWIEIDDLVLSGQFAWEGAVALAGDEDVGCIATHRYPILRGKPGLLNTAYLLALLKTKKGAFLLDEHSRGAAGRNRPLKINSLLKEKISIPPTEAQDEIAELVYLEKRFTRTIAEYSDRLDEYRQALITAAVTGQLDVESDRSLPEEAIA